MIHFTCPRRRLEVTQQENRSRRTLPLVYLFDELNYIKYNLIKNKAHNNCMVPELANIDYFMQVLGEVAAPDIGAIQNKLRLVEALSAIFYIDPRNLKSREHFIF
ncbi:MAG: IPExxxVDY family protein [Bacteroidales bacterium]|nr:IPExxxVDY family protein [Bacteroidales bacterium]